jgi:hypothetical protein
MFKWVKPGPNTLVHIKKYLGPYQHPLLFPRFLRWWSTIWFSRGSRKFEYDVTHPKSRPSSKTSRTDGHGRRTGPNKGMLKFANCPVLVLYYRNAVLHLSSKLYTTFNYTNLLRYIAQVLNNWTTNLIFHLSICMRMIFQRAQQDSNEFRKLIVCRFMP